MSEPPSKIRQQVLATIIDVMVDAEKFGGDAWKAAAAAFPGTPTDVIAEAWVDYNDRITEAWWQTVERTIDGEIIKRALSITGGDA